jgi:hypothetical protein
LKRDFKEKSKQSTNPWTKKLNRLTQQQTKTPQLKHEFYPRVVNKTDIAFSGQEVSPPQKSLRYNLHTKPKNWIQTLALEAETPI